MEGKHLEPMWGGHWKWGCSGHRRSVLTLGWTSCQPAISAMKSYRWRWGLWAWYNGQNSDFWNRSWYCHLIWDKLPDLSESHSFNLQIENRNTYGVGFEDTRTRYVKSITYSLAKTRWSIRTVNISFLSFSLLAGNYEFLALNWTSVLNLVLSSLQRL